MRKIFISLPMRDKTSYEIKEDRDRIISKLISRYGQFEILESIFTDVAAGSKSLYFLGKSFEVLSEADIAVFAKGWEKARGCLLEHDACLAYGIEIIREENLNE